MNAFEKVLIGGKTDIGIKRENNEDNYVIVDQGNESYNTKRYGMLFAVADGIGGHAAGEKASKMACDGLSAYYEYREKVPIADPIHAEHMLKHLEAVIYDIHQKILRFAEDNEAYNGMGTTLSVLVLAEDKGLVAHVGDSRIYRLRAESLEQLTKDHTEVQALVDMGRLRPDRAQTHPRRHILTQTIGVEDDLEEVYTRIVGVSEGDVFLLCSDGLYDVVDDELIKTMLLQNPSPQAVCNRLVEKALEQGGEDNVTVIVVKV